MAKANKNKANKSNLSSHNFVNSGIFALSKKLGHQLPDGTDVEVGDIVVCSSTQNWEDPDVLGRVVYACPKGYVLLVLVFIFFNIFFVVDFVCVCMHAGRNKS